MHKKEIEVFLTAAKDLNKLQKLVRQLQKDLRKQNITY